MKSIRILAAATAFSMLLPCLAVAQPDRRGDDRPPAGGHDRPDPQRHSGPAPGREQFGDRGQANRADPRDDHRGGPDDRGAGPDHAFRRGGRLPSDYRSHQYVVDDWRGHRLSAPPRGYQWVQTGADYVLVAVATGIIAQVLLGR